MIITSWKDVTTLCFSTPQAPISSAEYAVITYSQSCNFWQFMIATSWATDENREWHAQELRNARIELARALKEWEEEQRYGCWEGWPLRG